MTDLPEAQVKPLSHWSAIWVLPLIALFIAGWLAWQGYNQRGVKVEVLFESGEGIEVGKTAVVYKGMSVGTVRDLRLDEDRARQVVVATLEMNRDFEDHLRARTRFWLVRPSITLGGISGLETLVSGNYIGVSVGDGDKVRRFEALSEEPPMTDTRFGLHLTLQADSLGSLNRGSPVFYRQIQVGQVKNYMLSADQRTVEIQVFIKPEYTSLVHSQTRFWNASGVSVEAGLGGVKVHTESLASVVAGGIAFATPDSRKDDQPVDPAIPFRLYEDFETAQVGVSTTVILEDYDGLQEGRTPVLHKGRQVGLLKTLAIDSSLRRAEAELSMDPAFEEHLVEGTDFWVVKPSLSWAGVSGLDALVKGNYIAMRPGPSGAAPQRTFRALAKAPPLDLNAPGRHLVLVADTLGSLDVGSPVLFRQIKVGSVQHYEFSRDRQKVLINVHVEPAYAGLINTSSRFWNVSGISITGGLSGLQVRSESLQSLLLGGVAFETPDRQAPPGQRLPQFELYADRDQALERGTQIDIRLARGDGIVVGTPIRYKGLEVGQVESVGLSDDLQTVRLTARITEADEHFVRVGARYRVVRPELGLLRTAHLDTLISGPYLEVQPGRPEAARQTRFVAQEDLPEATEAAGLDLVLSAPRLGSIKPGNIVTYREVAVGRVTDYELGPNADRVLIRIRIEPRFAPLVRTGSRFWETSGFGFDFSLLKGASIRTDSLESLIEGGIAFATPEGGAMGNQALPGQTFALFATPENEWLEWAPKIALTAEKRP